MGACATYHVTREAALRRVFEHMPDDQLTILLEKVINDDLMNFVITEDGEDNSVIGESL